jgi:peptide/nickel transport system permease protein
MAAYIARRLIWVVFLLFVITLITFVIFSVLPSGDPAVARAGRQPTPELVATIRETLGLDKPWYVQYVKYLDRLVFHFDFGYSYQTNEPVKDQIFERVPATIALAVGGMLFWLAIGLPIGIFAALRAGTWADKAAMTLALVAISAPVYWLGLVALYLFSEDIGRFPILPGSGAFQDPGNIFDKIEALLMPWCVLATAFAAIYARLLRANLLEVLGEDYIRTARAKGLSERRVIFHHGMRSALTPIVTVLGLDVGILVGGAILTESVFNIPGIGRLTYDAIQVGDIVTVQGATLFLALAVCIANLLVDIMYSVLDPRVRLS